MGLITLGPFIMGQFVFVLLSKAINTTHHIHTGPQQMGGAQLEEEGLPRLSFNICIESPTVHDDDLIYFPFSCQQGKVSEEDRTLHLEHRYSQTVSTISSPLILLSSVKMCLPQSMDSSYFSHHVHIQLFLFFLSSYTVLSLSCLCPLLPLPSPP